MTLAMTLARFLCRRAIVPLVAFAALSGAARAQVEVPHGIEGPPAGIGGGINIQGPIIIDPVPRPIIVDPPPPPPQPIIIDPAPRPIIIDPPPPPPRPIIIDPPPPPPPPPPCIVGVNCGASLPPSPLTNGGAGLSPPSLVSPTDGILAATGVPILPDDQRNDPLTDAIHKQWLGYLQSIQATHQDSHWVNPPYDDWLQRHPEDRGVIPAVADAQNNPQPSAIAVTATPSTEPSNSTPPPAAPGIDKNLVGILLAGIAIAAYAILFWRGKRKGR